MKRGDLVKMKKMRQSRLQSGGAFRLYWSRVGVIIEVFAVGAAAGARGASCFVYWSDNVKSAHWETDLEMK